MIYPRIQIEYVTHFDRFCCESCNSFRLLHLYTVKTKKCGKKMKLKRYDKNKRSHAYSKANLKTYKMVALDVISSPAGLLNWWINLWTCEIKTDKSSRTMFWCKSCLWELQNLCCVLCSLISFLCVITALCGSSSPGHIPRMRRGRGLKWLSQSIQTSDASQSADHPHQPFWKARSWFQSHTHGCP